MDVETYTNFLLLQCASTFNWDVLEQRCHEISDLLVSSSSHQLTNGGVISDRQRRRVADAIRQLSQQDQYGNNCLHAACYNRPPLQVITSILQCASHANLQLHKVLTLDRSTPLGIACATGASTDVIKTLLEPPYGLDHGGNLVTLPDSRGFTPLSELVTHYELQHKRPGSSGALRSLDTIQSNLRSATTPVHSLTTITTTTVAADQEEESSPFETFWTKVELLIKAAWFDANNRNNFNFPGSWISIVHGASFVAESCPPELTLLICRSYPSMAETANRQGHLPLHLAIISDRSALLANTKTIARMTTAAASTTLRRRRALWVKTLLELDPQTASNPLPNGRSLLCEAIASDLHWNIPIQSGKVITGDEFADTTGPVQYIWRSLPEVLFQKDTQTGLYPLLLAAAQAQSGAYRSTKKPAKPAAGAVLHNKANPSGGDAEEDPDGSNQLDTIYGLLRVNPQFLNQLTCRN